MKIVFQYIDRQQLELGEVFQNNEPRRKRPRLLPTDEALAMPDMEPAAMSSDLVLNPQLEQLPTNSPQELVPNVATPIADELNISQERNTDEILAIDNELGASVILQDQGDKRRHTQLSDYLEETEIDIDSWVNWE